MTAITWVALVGIVAGVCAIFALKRFADSREFFVRVARSRFFSDECKEHVFVLRSLSFSPLFLIFLLQGAWTAKNDRDKILAASTMDSKEHKVCAFALLRALRVNATAYMPLYLIVIVLFGIRFVVHLVRQKTNDVENTILVINSPRFMNAAFAQYKK